MIELLEGEYFIPVKDYEGIYEISNYGRVKSLNYNKSGKESILKQRKCNDNSNRLRCTLIKDTIQKSFEIGMLVAKNFIENPEKLSNIKRLDGNSQNNKVDNIIWSRKYKNNNKVRLGLTTYTDEIFVDIIGYGGLYKISNYGNVYSLISNKLIDNYINNKGYMPVCLYKNNIRQYIHRHRLVAVHFIDNLENLYCVNHKDGNKLNNHVSNLEWCTLEDNNVHAKETGLLNPSDNTTSKNNPERVREIRKRYSNGETARQIAESYNISMDSVRDIKNNKTWKWVV